MKRLSLLPWRTLALAAAALVMIWTAPVLGADCNTNGLDDECDLDCAAQGGSQGEASVANFVRIY